MLRGWAAEKEVSDRNKYLLLICKNCAIENHSKTEYSHLRADTRAFLNFGPLSTSCNMFSTGKSGE